jgi:hypothetical protein
VPSFAGLWARMTFGAEPPPGGRQGIVNLMHRADGAFDGLKLVGDDKDPLLKPAAAAQVKRLGEISKSGEAFPDPSNQCAPQQPPYILRQQEIQLLQRKDEVTILYMLDHHVRHVRLNAQHPAKVTPSWMGDSVGHYEGDTLVVDTVGFVADTPLGQAGMHHSDKMRIEERFRLTGPDKMEIRTTISDPVALMKPWATTKTLARHRDWDIAEYVCEQNNRNYVNEEGKAGINLNK